MIADATLMTTLLPYVISIGSAIIAGLASIIVYLLQRIVSNTDMLATAVGTMQVGHAELKVRVGDLEEVVDGHEKALNHLAGRVCPANGDVVLVR